MFTFMNLHPDCRKDHLPHHYRSVINVFSCVNSRRLTRYLHLYFQLYSLRGAPIFHLPLSPLRGGDVHLRNHRSRTTHTIATNANVDLCVLLPFVQHVCAAFKAMSFGCKLGQRNKSGLC